MGHMKTPKKKEKQEKLVDEQQRFEIFPNGHRCFMTKSAQRTVVETSISDRDKATFEPLSDSMLRRTAKKASHTIPEPRDQYGGSENIVTLRLRALPGKKIPDLVEGDFIAGSAGSLYSEFRVLEIYWGTKTLANCIAQEGPRGGRRSTSDTNAFVVCEKVI